MLQAIDRWLQNHPGLPEKDVQEQACTQKPGFEPRYYLQILRQIPDGRYMNPIRTHLHEHIK